MNDSTAETGDPIRAAGTDTLYRLRITYDAGFGNPRTEYDHFLGVMAARHREYNLPQEDDTNPHQPHKGAWLAEQLDDRRTGGGPDGRSFRAVSRWLRTFHGATVVLPLYVTGGDDRLVAGGLDDDGDACCGLIYDTPATRARYYGDDPEGDDPATIAAMLTREVEQYTAWAQGEMTSWVVESYELPSDDLDALAEAIDAAELSVQRSAATEAYDDAIARARGDYTAEEDDAPGWMTVDSCGGYYSVDEARQMGTPALLAAVEEAEQGAANRADANREDDEEIRSMVEAELNQAAG